MKFIIDNWLLILVALGSGGMLLWSVVRGAGAGTLSAQGAVQLINRERAVVVDVREPEAFAAGRITGARNVPLAQLEARLAATVKNKTVPLVLVCESGARAQRAVATARKLGYERAQAMADGLKGWRAANLPIEKSEAIPSLK